MNKEDIEYLNEQFPKGKTKFRGQAMVLLSLARIEGAKEKDKELKELQKAYNIAMKEIARLRNLLGYDKIIGN